MSKVSGYGKKRDMLIGKLETKTNYPSHVKARVKHVAVIGGGLAGANAVYALAKRGIKVSLYTTEELASGASGNAQGGFYPQLHAQASNASQIQAHSFLFAHRLYSMLSEQAHFSHNWCGVMLLAFSEEAEKRQAKLVSNKIWPDSLIYPLSSNETTIQAGIPLPYNSLFFPQAGWISPPELVSALLAAAASITQLEIHTNTGIDSIEVAKGGVEISGNGTHKFDHVVLATGHDSKLVSGFIDLPFRRVRGQVEYIPNQSPLTGLKTVLCHKGYLTPAMKGRHALGSTYVRQDLQTDYRAEEELINLNTHQNALSKTEWANHMVADQTGRASIRMTLPDHQPVTGTLSTDKAQNKVSILSGLGSRGLTTAPLMAELLVSQLTQSPIPISKTLLEALSPLRFIRRANKSAR